MSKFGKAENEGNDPALAKSSMAQSKKNIGNVSMLDVKNTNSKTNPSGERKKQDQGTTQTEWTTQTSYTQFPFDMRGMPNSKRNKQVKSNNNNSPSFSTTSIGVIVGCSVVIVLIIFIIIIDMCRRQRKRRRANEQYQQQISNTAVNNNNTFNNNHDESNLHHNVEFSVDQQDQQARYTPVPKTISNQTNSNGSPPQPTAPMAGVMAQITIPYEPIIPHLHTFPNNHQQDRTSATYEELYDVEKHDTKKENNTDNNDKGDTYDNFTPSVAGVETQGKVNKEEAEEEEDVTKENETNYFELENEILSENKCKSSDQVSEQENTYKTFDVAASYDEIMSAVEQFETDEDGRDNNEHDDDDEEGDRYFELDKRVEEETFEETGELYELATHYDDEQRFNHNDEDNEADADYNVDAVVVFDDDDGHTRTDENEENKEEPMCTEVCNVYFESET